jgi:hypothetical protein
MQKKETEIHQMSLLFLLRLCAYVPSVNSVFREKWCPQDFCWHLELRLLEFRLFRFVKDDDLWLCRNELRRRRRRHLSSFDWDVKLYGLRVGRYWRSPIGWARNSVMRPL